MKRNPENRKTNFKKNISSSFKRIKKTPYDIKIHPPIWKKNIKKKINQYNKRKSKKNSNQYIKLL